jgi:heat shock protein HslJ
MFFSIHPTRPPALLLASVILLVTACGSSSESLPESSWKVNSLAGAEIPDAIFAGLDFVDESRLSVLTGCNDFVGPYETDSGTISIGPLAGTLKACPDPLMAFEAAYTAALERAATYVVDGDVLTLTGPEGASLVTLDRFEQELAGTAWQVISYNNGKEAVVSVTIGTEITAAFADDGTAAGSGSCNDYSGSYEINGGGISIGLLGSTQNACGQPKGVMEQESLYLGALQSTTTWQVRGTTLELRDDGGALQVSAQPAG